MKFVFAFAILFSSVFASAQTIPVASPIDLTATMQAVVQATPVAAIVEDPSLVPPVWMQEALVTVKTLPVVGPFAVTALQWLGVFGAIMTALCAFLLTALKALGTVSNLAQLTAFADKLNAFQSSKVMYWLKYFSMFNAPKSQDKKPA